MTPDDVDLPKSYKMYRTPHYIAELATRFMVNNALVKQEFVEHGYTSEFSFTNKLDNGAEVLRSPDPVADITARVKSMLNGGYTADDIMVITHESKMAAFRTAIEVADIPYLVGETREITDRLTLVDFMNVKGLEKPVVFVCDIENLYDRTQAGNLFDNADARARRERRARRITYVSLTRACEELIVYYRDPGHPFVSELVTINNRILQKRSPHGV